MNLQAMAGGSKHWLIALTVRQKSPDPLRRANRSDIAVSIAGLGFKTRVWSIPRPASSQGRGRMLAARKLLLKDVPVTGRKSRYRSPDLFYLVIATAILTTYRFPKRARGNAYSP